MPPLKQRKIAVTMDDGSLRVMSFLTVGRGNVLPYGARWGAGPPSDLEDQRTGLWSAESLRGSREGYWSREASDANVMAELIKSFPEVAADTGERLSQPVSYRLISDFALPEDRTYRGAWRDDGAGAQIVHDMGKAREIHLAGVRRARAAKLEGLDRDWMRATGQGKKRDADVIEAKRQALRDLPTTLGVEDAKTIDELKAKWSPLLDAE